jgi:hypothetical protein
VVHGDSLRPATGLDMVAMVVAVDVVVIPRAVNPGKQLSDG